jgi:hypothetical protein
VYRLAFAIGAAFLPVACSGRKFAPGNPICWGDLCQDAICRGGALHLTKGLFCDRLLEIKEVGMSRKAFFIVVLSVMLCAANRACCAEGPALLVPGTASEVAPETAVDIEMQWLWGEASAIDAQNKTLMVKYLDYETDQEKEMLLSIDDKTAFENVKSLEEIKVQDTLSIDYIIGADGKNAARNISVERPEEAVIPLENIDPLGTYEPSLKLEGAPVSEPQIKTEGAPQADLEPKKQ